MTVGLDRGDRHLVALGQRWQQRLVVGVVVAGLFLRRDIDGAVAGEGDRGARRRELAVGQFARCPIGGVRCEAHADGDTGGVGHLRRQGALPDQPVEREFLAVEFGSETLRRPIRRGRADRLVGLLGVLHLRRVLLRCSVEIVGAVLTRDGCPCCLHCLVGQHDVVRTHVGDEAALVQPLGDAHHLRRRQAQLATAFLLQRRGHERRLRRRAVWLLLDRPHGERGVAQAIGQPAGTRLVERHGLGRHLTLGIEILAGGNPVAADGDELGRERRLRGGADIDVPVVGGDVRDAFALALHDQPDRWALDAPGRQAPVDAAPQHRRHLVAVEPVEDASGLSGVDEAVVEAPGIVDGVVDSGLGDLVEHHPLHGDLRLEVLDQVPRDRFALAVFIRCEVELGGILQRRLEVFDHGLAALGELVSGFEPVVDVDVQPFARQVGHVAHRGAYVVVAAEELRQRLRLGGRFDDDEGFGHQCLSKLSWGVFAT